MGLGAEGIEEPPPGLFAEVATAEAFQVALENGVEHILLTAHLDMLSSPFAPDVVGVEALNKAIGRVLDSTKSIAVCVLNSGRVQISVHGCEGWNCCLQ